MNYVPWMGHKQAWLLFILLSFVMSWTRRKHENQSIKSKPRWLSKRDEKRYSQRSGLSTILYDEEVALEGNFVCLVWLDYQSLKDYFLKSTKRKLNISVSMCFWKIALYCKLNFIFQNQFNQKLCNIMRKKLGYALWLKIACPGQITHQKFLFPLQDLTTAYKTVSQNFDIWFHSFVMSYRL